MAPPTIALLGPPKIQGISTTQSPTPPPIRSKNVKQSSSKRKVSRYSSTDSDSSESSGSPVRSRRVKPSSTKRKASSYSSTDSDSSEYSSSPIRSRRVKPSSTKRKPSPYISTDSDSSEYSSSPIRSRRVKPLLTKGKASPYSSTDSDSSEYSSSPIRSRRVKPSSTKRKASPYSSTDSDSSEYSSSPIRSRRVKPSSSKQKASSYSSTEESSDSEFSPRGMGYTENGSATFLSTGNPCLDFFFHVVPDTPPKQLLKRLEVAWNSNALTTLKLICNLRGVRGTGKSEKEGFYTAALWLHSYHPKTLACNIKVIADFGYFKDVLEILYRLLEGADVRKNEKKEWEKRKNSGFLEKKGSKRAKERELVTKGKAKKIRLEKTMSKAQKILDKYTQDQAFQFLYDKVSGFFSDALKEDMKLYNEGKLYELSLAAKWCPSLDSCFDKALLMCESVGRKVFPRDEYIEYQDLEDAHYAYRVRDRLRKEVLVPLRKALEIPEVYICANKWEELPYKRVPSVAMKLYKKLFYKHDKERFEGYLADVKSGKTTIAAGALLPHEIIASLNDSTGPEVAELQWERMVDDLAKKGKLSNCMAVCDVSGSMHGTPMEVSVALGLLISELSEEPWKGKLITFSSDPEIHLVKGKNLSKKAKFIREMEWGMNTDFQKVFDEILKVAVKGKLSEDQMIKRLFVFSDMEFDQASTSPWETDYQVIKRKFKKRGYEKVPEIVFWNLRNSVATPVPSSQEGVALVSGFSKNLVTLFLEEGGIMNPEAVMMQALSGEEYQKLVVYD